MAYTTIDDPSEYFHTQIYTGNGSAPRDITNDANAGDFQPDWVWVKNRDSGGNNHHLFTSSQPGSGYVGHLSTDLTVAEASATNKVIALNSDGFRLGGTHSSVNANGDKYVAWQWVVNGGSASASGTESGLNAAYSRQTNSTAGISIITYTGLGTSGTGSSPVVPHGLGAVPHFILIKNRTHNSGNGSGTNWVVYHKDMDETEPQDYSLYISTAGRGDYVGMFNDTAPTSTTFTVGTHMTVNSGDPNYYMAYVWTEIENFSKFGIYHGNGNIDGPSIFTGFRPALLVVKNRDTTGSWAVSDSARSPFNEIANTLLWDDDATESGVSNDLNVDFGIIPD